MRTSAQISVYPLRQQHLGPAVEAVRQWRYQPLLLNGEPTAFILTVTVAFNLRAPD